MNDIRCHRKVSCRFAFKSGSSPLLSFRSLRCTGRDSRSGALFHFRTELIYIEGYQEFEGAINGQKDKPRGRRATAVDLVAFASIPFVFSAFEPRGLRIERRRGELDEPGCRFSDGSCRSADGERFGVGGACLQTVKRLKVRDPHSNKPLMAE